MTRRRVAAGIALYAGCWLLTAKFGPRSAEPRIRERMERRWKSPLPAAESVAAGRAHYPYFAIRTLTPAPFVLFSEYGSGTGIDAEEGGHAWTAWFFGWSLPVRSTVTWRAPRHSTGSDDAAH